MEYMNSFNNIVQLNEVIEKMKLQNDEYFFFYNPLINKYYGVSDLVIGLAEEISNNEMPEEYSEWEKDEIKKT